MNGRDRSDLKYVLFDLDETLYPATSGLMPAIGERMRLYLEAKYGLSPHDAQALQMRYWTEYGTTLRGLMLEREIDPEDYLLYVHDVDVARHVNPDPRLREMLMQITYEKVIMTNADRPHAERVLARLGVADQFTRIFDIVFMEYECKPAQAAYVRVLDALHAEGRECILVEDSVRNLAPARALGIRTILVASPQGTTAPFGFPVDPAWHHLAEGCPEDASICVPEIYRVKEAIGTIA